jgi:glycine cleavage system H protein
VELPEVGTEFSAGDESAVVESVKAAADVYAPIAGEVVKVNSDLEDAPELINQDPYGKGWLYQLKVRDASDVDAMLCAESYDELCPES